MSSLQQGVRQQRVVHQNTLTTGSAGDGQTRPRALELSTDSEALEWQL